MVSLVTLGPRLRRGNMSGSLRRQRLFGAFLRLAVPHFGVETGLSQQAGMRAALDDQAGVEDDDLVGRDHRRQAGRDPDRGAALFDAFARPLDLGLGAAVARAGGFVEERAGVVLS